MKSVAWFTLGAIASCVGTTFGQVSYFTDFQSGAGPEWSNQTVETAPLGGQKILGQFSNQTVTLTMDEIRAGERVLLSFDFCAIRTWDGNIGGGGPGPDIFSVQVDNGPILLSSTFSVGDPESAHTMSYPFVAGMGYFPSLTGATSVDTLGYQWRDRVLDATWRMNFEFTAPTDVVRINFSALGLQSIDDESWALDNVVVSTITVPAPGAGAVAGLASLTLVRRKRR